MGRAVTLLVAVLCYFAFFASFVYLVGFVAGLPFMPTSVDKGMIAEPVIAAVVDIGLIAIFGLQHSVMARQGFKAAWTRTVPEPMERSLYCLATAIALALMFTLWHPIGGTVWTVSNETARMVLWGLFLLGWSIVFISTWLINHFELFGLAQAWRHFRGLEAKPHQLHMPLFYKAVRHPIYTGFFIALWATPDMSYSHLLLALGLTIYLLIGIRYEERDLVAYFGETYVEYRRKVGMIVPGIGKGS